MTREDVLEFHNLDGKSFGVFGSKEAIKQLIDLLAERDELRSTMLSIAPQYVKAK